MSWSSVCQESELLLQILWYKWIYSTYKHRNDLLCCTESKRTLPSFTIVKIHFFVNRKNIQPWSRNKYCKNVTISRWGTVGKHGLVDAVLNRPGAGAKWRRTRVGDRNNSWSEWTRVGEQSNSWFGRTRVWNRNKSWSGRDLEPSLSQVWGTGPSILRYVSV